MDIENAPRLRGFLESSTQAILGDVGSILGFGISCGPPLAGP